MRVYFSPLACSLATRITLYETGEAAEFVEVDPKTKRTLGEDVDYREIHPLGLVPSIQVDGSEALTENAAILQFIADRRPAAGLAPADPAGRSRLQQWLCFIGTELHKGLFAPMLDPKAPAEAKAYALSKYASRLTYLDGRLANREYLLEAFSVADAYLVAVLNWTQAVPAIQLTDYPALAAYMKRLRERPSVAAALREEAQLFRAERARHAA